MLDRQGHRRRPPHRERFVLPASLPANPHLLPPSPLTQLFAVLMMTFFPERAKVRRAMEQTLLTTAMKIVTFANTNKDHIPPITTQGGNPFPYKINIDQHKDTGWAGRMRIY